LETPAFQKSLKYRRLAQGIEVLEDDDAIYNQLVATITEQHGQVSTRSSVEEVLDLFVDEVKTYTEGMGLDDDAEVSESVQDLFVDEEDVDRGEAIETDGGVTVPAGVDAIAEVAHYHVVCHDCPVETTPSSEAAAAEITAVHNEASEHDVEYARIDQGSELEDRRLSQ
jgi:hypothetical protein